MDNTLSCIDCICLPMCRIRYKEYIQSETRAVVTGTFVGQCIQLSHYICVPFESIDRSCNFHQYMRKGTLYLK